MADNDIFGVHGYIFENTFAFIQSGISDTFANMFYFRYVRQGPTKIKIQMSDNDIMSTMSANIRFVAQIHHKIDQNKALVSLLAQIAHFEPVIRIENFSDDSIGVYKAEYNTDMVNRDFNLISIDFTATEEVVLKNTDCECLCVNNC